MRRKGRAPTFDLGAATGLGGAPSVVEQTMPRTCTFEGCTRPHSAKGYCKAHYMRFTRGSASTAPIVQRKHTPAGEPMHFAAEVAAKHTGDECLIWPYGRDTHGYGLLTVDGQVMVASRYVCTLVHGEPSDPAMHAAHLCNQGHLGCVNPRHLAWKTVWQNYLDKVEAGTVARGPQMPQAVLTEGDVRQIRALYPTLSAKRLGVKFGVCESTIFAVLKRKKWAWVED